MPSNTFFPKLTSINFTVKNLSANRKIHIFNYPINPGQTRDLLAIPEISEMDIRHSLIKGELANFIRNKTISIVSSSIDLTQFDPQQLQFLTSASSLTPNVINPPPNPNANLSDGHSLITQNTTAGGDLIGQLSNLNINKLQGNLLQASSPSIGNILTYNGTAWTPQIAPSGTFLPGQDLTGSSILQRVIGIDGYAITTKPLPGQGLVLQSNGTYQHQSSPFVKNVKEFGALGDGITDDTVAIQRALNVFSGNSSGVCATLYFPQGIYKITSQLTYIGNSGKSLILQGEICGAGVLGSVIKWTGATSILTNYDGYFNCVNGNAIIATTTDQTSHISAGQFIHFHSDTNDYTVSIVNSGNIVLTAPYSGITNASTTAQFATMPTMLHTYGANSLFINNLFFNGNALAYCGLWLSTNQPAGGSASNGIQLKDSFFYGFVGIGYTDFTYTGTQGCLIIGDYQSPQNNQQVSAVNAYNCGFAGQNMTGSSFACINALGGFNTEQFKFADCSFVDALYIFISDWHPNNEIEFNNCQLFATICNFKLGFGSATLRLINCGCETSSLTSPYTGKTYHVISGRKNSVYINGGEMNIDCSQNPNGELFFCQGILEIRNAIISGDGGLSTGHCAVVKLGAVNNIVSPADCALTIKNCTWSYATQQIPVIDGSSNNLTLLGFGAGAGQINYGSQINGSIDFFGNQGTNLSGNTFWLPRLMGDRLQMNSVGVLPAVIGIDSNGLVSPNYIPTITVAVNQVRQTTNIWTIPFGVFNQTAATTRTLKQQILVPKKVKIVSVVASVDIAFVSSSGSMSALQVDVGDGYNGAEWYLKKHDIFTATTTYPIGGQITDLGTALSINSCQGGYYGLWNTFNGLSPSTINVNFTAVGANLNTLTQGTLTVYLTTEALYA